MSNMSSFWSSFGLSSNSAAKTERAKAQLQMDIKYLYSAFTKIPCLRLSPDRRARMISGYEEFPFDTAVPLVAFKNVSALEIYDLDFRQFFGWDKLADQLRSLTIKRGQLDDPLDLIVHIVLDDMDKRRRRSSKPQSPPTPIWPASPSIRHPDLTRMNSSPSTPLGDGSVLATSASPRDSLFLRGDVDISVSRTHQRSRNKSVSPTRPAHTRQGPSYRHVRGRDKLKRSGSGSSNSSTHSLTGVPRNRSSSNLLSMGILPASKWRFLRHLSLADNALTTLSAAGLAPLANSLHSLDLSSNLLKEVPDCLASLAALRALNLSNCMIDSLHSLARNPLPAITALNLRGNRLMSMAGIERLLSLERLDIRDNKLLDPTELARLTGIPDIREIWVASNPFVKSHSNYRVTIFNLFRSTSGYTDDITIDSSGPGYSERRYLRDRVAEAAAVPIVRPTPTDSGMTDPPPDKVAKLPSIIATHVVVGNRPIPRSTQSESVVGTSNRLKKGARRRIVDLSIDEGTNKANFPSAEPTRLRPSVPTPEQSDTNVSLNEEESFRARITSHIIAEDDPFIADSKALKPQNSTITPPSTPPGNPGHAEQGAVDSLATDTQKLDIHGGTYRHKAETFKDKFGSGWLRAMNEEGWDGRPAEHEGPGPDLASNGALKTDLTGLRSPSQAIVSGGRTLG